MAKELPYFQFEPAEYLTKDISFCSLSAQGLFINICSFYWQRGCKLTKIQVLRRFNHPDVLKELDAEGVIKYDNEDNIIIMFLLKQFESIVVKKSNDSEKGKIGNLKRWHRETYNRFIKNEISLDEALSIANSSGGDTLAITKISQIREDKIKENNTTTKEAEVDFFKVDEWIKEIGKSDIFLEGLYRTHKLYKGSISELLNNFKEHLKIYPKLHNNFSDFKKHFASWLNIKSNKKELGKYQKQSKGQL